MSPSRHRVTRALLWACFLPSAFAGKPYNVRARRDWFFEMGRTVKDLKFGERSWKRRALAQGPGAQRELGRSCSACCAAPGPGGETIVCPCHRPCRAPRSRTPTPGGWATVWETVCAVSLVLARTGRSLYSVISLICWPPAGLPQGTGNILARPALDGGMFPALWGAEPRPQTPPLSARSTPVTTATCVPRRRPVSPEGQDDPGENRWVVPAVRASLLSARRAEAA